MSEQQTPPIAPEPPQKRKIIVLADWKELELRVLATLGPDPIQGLIDTAVKVF